MCEEINIGSKVAVVLGCTEHRRGERLYQSYDVAYTSTYSLRCRRGDNFATFSFAVSELSFYRTKPSLLLPLGWLAGWLGGARCTALLARSLPLLIVDWNNLSTHPSTYPPINQSVRYIVSRQEGDYR